MNRQQRRQATRSAKKKARQSGSSRSSTSSSAGRATQEMAAAKQLHAAGELANAVVRYRRALEHAPDQPDALHLMGMAEHQMGRDDAAIELIGRALAINPNYANAQGNLGAILLKQDRAEEAESHFRRAIAIDPGHAQAHGNLGIILKNRKDFDEAEHSLRRTLALEPGHEGALENLVGVLLEQGRHEEAEPHARRMIAANPNSASAHNALGAALYKQDKIDQAAASFVQAVAIDPGYVDAHNNLGLIRKNEGDFEAAASCHRRAIEIDPECVIAYLALGNILKILGQVGAMVDCYRRAIEIEPDYIEAYNNLGSALRDHGDAEEAVATYRKTIDLKPDFVQAHSNLVFSLNYSARTTPEEIFAESRRWDAVHAAPLAARARPHANDPGPERRLRVGYVSPDFRVHSVSYFLEPLLAAHDRQAVEIFCYAEVAEPDDTTARLRELADGWCSTIGMTNAEVADRIRNDRIDILVDLAGHTANNRLLAFAERPAPVQVTWLGYGETTGMRAIDYRLSDAIVDPEGAERLSTEIVTRLPNGFLCYGPDRDAPDVTISPALENGHITFGSFNNLAKIRPETVAAWARILEQLPGTRLMIKSKPLADEGTRKRYLELFAAQGIGAERLDLVAWIPSKSGHLGAYGRIDIALDTFPYNGTTTTCEALWMGVPVIALRGERAIPRMAASILTRVGLAELVAEDTESYVETAVALAGDRDRLAALRRDLRGRLRASPLCDAQGFARNVETAYRDMWRRWCQGAHRGALEQRREAAGE